jgi:hypothetical protein
MGCTSVIVERGTEMNEEIKMKILWDDHPEKFESCREGILTEITEYHSGILFVGEDDYLLRMKVEINDLRPNGDLKPQYLIFYSARGCGSARMCGRDIMPESTWQKIEDYVLKSFKEKGGLLTHKIDFCNFTWKGQKSKQKYCWGSGEKHECQKVKNHPGPHTCLCDEEHYKKHATRLCNFTWQRRNRTFYGDHKKHECSKPKAHSGPHKCWCDQMHRREKKP